jgi:predicted ATP-grasp superfamily ATP-dependent carboligase
MRILIVGVSTRAIAESARAAGYDFVTLDYFGDYDQKRLCENYSLKRDFGLPFGSAELYESSQKLNFDSVVYLSNLENHPEIVARFAADHRGEKYVQVLGNSAAVLGRVRHWPAFFGFLRQQGIPTPATIFADQVPPDDVRREWLRKPIRSGGGHGIAFWPADQPVGKGFLLQEYLEGQPCSASFVANGRECVILGMTEQLVGLAEFGASAFRYCGNILPLAEEETRQTTLTQVRHITCGLTQEFGLVGVNGLDFLLKDGQVYPLEVNPRYSASMELIEQAYGLPIFDLHVRAITQQVLPDFDLASAAWKTEPRFYGKAILYAEREGRAPNTQDWSKRGIRDVPFPGEDLTRGGPVCTVLAPASTRDDCFAKLVAQVKTLKGEIYA